jgi:hypothetical protein
MKNEKNDIPFWSLFANPVQIWDWRPICVPVWFVDGAAATRIRRCCTDVRPWWSEFARIVVSWVLVIEVMARFWKAMDLWWYLMFEETVTSDSCLVTLVLELWRTGLWIEVDWNCVSLLLIGAMAFVRFWGIVAVMSMSFYAYLYVYMLWDLEVMKNWSLGLCVSFDEFACDFCAIPPLIVFCR